MYVPSYQFNTNYYMMKYLFNFLIIVLSMLFTNCKKTSVDLHPPEIRLDIPGAFPVNCDTLYFGDTFTFKVLFTDNFELGEHEAVSISIHDNFNHHAHSTEISDCPRSPAPSSNSPNGFTMIQNFSIPGGKKEHEAEIDFYIPTGDDDGEYDEGDYHFFISLADKEGWSAQKGLNIKILKK